QSHGMLRPESGAAFSIEIGGEERLVVVQEVEGRGQVTAIEEVAATIREAVAEHHDIQVQTVALIRAGSIPKTTSGKIQRRACRDAFLSTKLALVGLSALDAESPDASEQEPSGHVTRDELLALPVDQRRVALIASLEALAARLLRLPSNPRTEQPLTTLGLDSLIATELAHAVENRFGVSLSLPALLEGASIGELTDAVLDQVADSPRPAPTFREAGDALEYPLSRNQSALWFLNQLNPGSGAANAAVLLSIRGPVDATVLQQALEKLAARHPALRTTYGSRHGVPFQQIHPPRPPLFEETDASLWDWDNLQANAVKAAGIPFDLERGPLWRAQLFTRSSTTAYLVFAAHHIAVDGWSMRILIEDLQRLYGEQRTGQTRALLEHPTQYSDFVRWQ